MPTRIPAGHDATINEFIDRLSRFYLRTNRRTQTVDAPKGSIVKFPLNNAYPERMQALIDELGRLTNKIPIHLGDKQTARDFVAWEGRLAHYRAEQSRAMRESPMNADARYRNEVVFPLLTGLRPNDLQGRNDAITPIVIANQARIANDAYRENLTRFLDDLAENAKHVADVGVDFGLPILLGVAVLAVGVYAYAKGSK